MTFFRTLLGLARLAADAIRRVLGPVVGVVSPLGWIVLLAAAASVLAAWWFGWAEFLYLGLTLAAGLVIAAFFLIGHASFHVEITLSPRRVIAGERAFGRLLVTNIGARRSSATRLELPVGRGEADFSVPPLAAGSEHEELFAVPTARRAVITAGPALSVRGDQLGLLRRRVRWADPVELFVHPVTTLLAPSQAGLVRDLEGAVTSTLTNSDLEFHALRPYEPGDDQRYVHWRASARSGQLMVRQFQETRRSELVLVQLVDIAGYARTPGSAGDAGSAGHDAARFETGSLAEFELAVSVLASVGAQVLREKTRARVVTETRELRTATVTTLLDDSCRLEAVALRETPREFIRGVLAHMPPPSVLVVVTGSQTPIGELRAIEAVVGSDTRLIALRVELGGQPRISPVSRLHVLTIGELGDLPKLLRRVS